MLITLSKHLYMLFLDIFLALHTCCPQCRQFILPNSLLTAYFILSSGQRRLHGYSPMLTSIFMSYLASLDVGLPLLSQRQLLCSTIYVWWLHYTMATMGHEKVVSFAKFMLLSPICVPYSIPAHVILPLQACTNYQYKNRWFIKLSFMSTPQSFSNLPNEMSELLCLPLPNLGW